MTDTTKYTHPSASLFRDGDVVAMIGDSITWDGRWWLRLREQGLARGLQCAFVNRGIPGGGAEGAVLGYDWDIAPVRATVAMVMFGMNDVWRDAYVPAPTEEMLTGRNAVLQRYLVAMHTLVERLLRDGVRVVLLTPTPFDQYAPEVETTFRAYGETNGVVYPAHGTQNGTAVLRSCKHPELAIQVLNYIMMDKEMNQLVQAGIEGVHYELRDGLWYSLAKTEPFPFPDEGLNTWNLRVKEYKMVKPADVGLNEIFARLEAVGAKTKFPNVNIQQGFAEDFSEYEAERAAVIAVIEQYLRPLEAGVVDDVDAAVAEFLEKAEAAGLAKCREGFKAQWLAYCEAYGYK
jgi:hypothetical protein